MNRAMHFEIPARDIERADDFYEKVFGWKIKRDEMPEDQYHIATTVSPDGASRGINGALMERDGIVKAPALTIRVPNIKVHMKKIEENGGKVLTSIQTVGNMGIYIRFSDTEGNVVVLWQDLPASLN